MIHYEEMGKEANAFHFAFTVGSARVHTCENIVSVQSWKSN